MATLERVLGAGLLLDEECVIVDANNRSEVVFRTEVDELLDRSLTELQTEGVLDDHTLRIWKQAIRDVFEGVTKNRSEQIVLRPFGSDEEVRYELSVTPVSDGGYPDQVCCSLQSIGPNERYDETVTALETAMRELMTADDVDEVLEQTAVAAYDVLGFPGIGVRKYDPQRETLEFVSFGSRVEDINTRPSYSIEGSPHGRALRRSETVIEDIGEEDPYDREVFTQTMYLPIGTRGVLSVGTIGNTFDETDVQFAEILAENASAAVRVVDTTNRLREERERLELLRQILCRALRHNLRNDMSVIKANAELLREQADESAEVLVENIISAVDDVTALSDKAEVFDSLIDDSQYRQYLDVTEQVHNALTDVSRTYPGVTFDVTGTGSTMVYAHSAIDLAFANLLENACEYTDDDVISVRIEETADHVTVSVADDGPGIPDIEIAVLESRSETALEHSNGLGLWVVKWVVEQSGGDLSFDTSDGTRVDIQLGRKHSDYGSAGSQ